MKHVLRSSLLALFALATAIAQQQPICSVPVPATDNAGVQGVMVSDLAHSMVYIVYSQSILPIAVKDCTIGIPILLPKTAASVVSPGAKPYVTACIDTTTGTIATVAMVSIQTGATIIQTVDPASGTLASIEPALNQFNSGDGCAFGGGKLYVGSAFETTFANGSSTGYSAIIALDPATLSITATWPKVGIGPLFSMAASPLGQIYILDMLADAQCALVYACPTEIDRLETGGTFTALAQWTGPQEPMPMFVAPNGFIYVPGKVFDTNGQPYHGTVYSNIPVFNGITFPSADPWYGYLSSPGACTGGDLAFVDGTTDATGVILTMPGQTYLGVVAERQSDGTDLVVTQRSNFIDSYRVAPPQMIHFAANAGLFESSPFSPVANPALAPGSLITIYGQGLGALTQYDVADTTKIVTQLGNVSVTLDFVATKPLQLLFVGYNQINAALPRSVANGLHTLSVMNGATTVGQVNVTVVNQSVADFMWSPDPANPSVTQPIITDIVNGQYVLVGDPALGFGYAQASGGDVITFWFTGGGPTSPSLADGIAVTPYPPLYLLSIPPQVLVDGNPIPVAYAGLAPLETPGLNQLNAIVPYGLTPGKHDVTLGAVLYKGGLWAK